MSIPLLRRLLMKEAVKDTAGSSGIMSINKNIAAKVEQQLQRYVNDAMRQGVDLDTLSPEQLKMIVQMNKPKPPRVIAGDSPEGRGIMEALLGKRGEVVNFPQKRSFKQEVDDMIKDGTITKGARGMKKSKKVQDREMFQDANKRLKTEAQLKAEMEANNKKGVAGIKKQRQLTDDEIRDYEAELGDSETWMMDGTVGEAETALKNQKAYIADMELQYKKGKLDPEPGSRTPQRKRFLQSKLDEAETSGDARLLSREEREELFDLDDIPEYADGGVAGLLGERTGFKGGGMDAKDFGKSKSSKKGRTDAQSQYGGTKGYQSSKNKSGRTTTTSGQGGGSGYTNTGGGGGGGPPGTNTGGGTTTTTTTVPSNFREILKQRQILKSLGLIDEEDLALGIGPAPSVLGTIFKEGVKGVKPKFGKKGLGLEYLKEMDPYGNSLKFNLGTEYKDLLKGKLKPKLELKGTKGDLEYGFGMDKDKNINFGIKMPFGKQPKVAPRNFQDRLAPDISEFNFGDMTGITSQAPTNMLMADALTTPTEGKLGLNLTDYSTLKNVGYSDGQIEELQLNPEIDTQEVIRDIKGPIFAGADGGPARQNFKMGKRAFLKAMLGTGAGIAGLKSGLFGMGGKEATKKAVTETVKSAGSGTPPPYFFRLVEKIKFMGDDALATQDKAIAKKYKDYTMEEDFAGNIEIIKKGDNVAEDVYISYKVDDVPLRGKKGSKRVEEYEEYTARPDAEGKMKDIEQGVPDEVIDEAGDTTAMTLKRSSGGIARMLGE